jgi:5-formyltetrahydrofolate cyclo-ligase
MGGFDDAGKSRLRREFIARGRALGVAELAAASRAVCGWIAGSAELGSARHLVAYCARRGEIDPRELVREAAARGIATYYPCVVGDELEFRRGVEDELRPGAFGIPEPPAGAEVLGDGVAGLLILVPGVAFDRRGGRLGSGHGYYDRALARIPSAVRLGLATQAMVVDRLPQDPWDVCMNAVVTERGVLRTSPASDVHPGELT